MGRKSRLGEELGAVERREAHAVGFWDALAEHDWRRDERMMRYIKTG